jgi:hypothetical protein
MKKIVILIMIIAISVAFEQVSPDKNVYVTVIAIVVLCMA